MTKYFVFLLIFLMMTSCNNVRSLTVTIDPIRGQIDVLDVGKKVDPAHSIQLSNDGTAEIKLYLYYANMSETLKVTSSLQIRREHDQYYVIPSQVLVTNEDGTPVAKNSSIGPLALAIQYESENSFSIQLQEKINPSGPDANMRKIYWIDFTVANRP